MIENGDQQFAPPPPPDGLHGADGNPWERRAILGYGAGLLESIKLFVTSPGAAYEQTKKRGDFVSPLLFSVIIGWFGAILGQIWQFLFQDAMMSMFPPDMRDQLSLYMATTPLSLAISMLLTPIFLIIGLFIWSLVHHLSLMLVGALSESDSGFEGTYRVNGYAYVVQLAAIVPFVGWLISGFWYIALMTIGAARIHQTTTNRALVAALLPFVACCACVALLIFIVGWVLASAFQ